MRIKCFHLQYGRRCIIHYNIKDAKYSKVKTISEINKQRILEARNLGITKGGPNYHKEQCDSIPEEITLSEHGIHLEQCYKKFVLIVYINYEEKRSYIKDTTFRGHLVLIIK